MSIHAGRPLRLELYGLAVAGTIIVFWINDRIRIYVEIQKRIVKELERPQIIQNNNQQVTIEDPRERLIRELATQQGWKSNVNGNAEQSLASVRNERIRLLQALNVAMAGVIAAQIDLQDNTNQECVLLGQSHDFGCNLQ